MMVWHERQRGRYTPTGHPPSVFISISSFRRRLEAMEVIVMITGWYESARPNSGQPVLTQRPVPLFDERTRTGTGTTSTRWPVQIMNKGTCSARNQCWVVVAIPVTVIDMCTVYWCVLCCCTWIYGNARLDR
jgi:hypothetical protein